MTVGLGSTMTNFPAVTPPRVTVAPTENPVPVITMLAPPEVLAVLGETLVITGCACGTGGGDGAAGGPPQVTPNMINWPIGSAARNRRRSMCSPRSVVARASRWRNYLDKGGTVSTTLVPVP